MTEKEKMIAGELYMASDKQLTIDRTKAQKLCHAFNKTHSMQMQKRNKILNKLINCNKNTYIEPPFRCDYGYNITVGDYFYANYNLCILDCGKVQIGDDVLIAPNVSIFTATHPQDAFERCDVGKEFGKAIKIGNKVWIGGGAIILPGVTIGDESIVGAGSVVVNDVPSKCVVAGNPAKIIRQLK